MIDGYQLEVFFFDQKRVLCRFQRVSGTNKEIKRSWRPSLVWSRNRLSTIFHHSIILQPCRFCFYDPVGPQSTIMRWVCPRLSVGSVFHDRAFGVCPRSIGLLQVCYRSVTGLLQVCYSLHKQPHSKHHYRPHSID